MAFISETLQMRRLTENSVNIRTTYIADGSLRYRTTDGTTQDDVNHCIRENVYGKWYSLKNWFVDGQWGEQYW